jgi:hypothetical protein
VWINGRLIRTLLLDHKVEPTIIRTSIIYIYYRLSPRIIKQFFITAANTVVTQHGFRVHDDCNLHLNSKPWKQRIKDQQLIIKSTNRYIEVYVHLSYGIGSTNMVAVLYFESGTNNQLNHPMIIHAACMETILWLLRILFWTSHFCVKYMSHRVGYLDHDFASPSNTRTW